MRAEQKSDFDLVQEFIDGKDSSIEVLINRHKDRVFTYILLLVKNEELAEDIFQDTFVKVINSLRQKKYKDEGRFVSWVLRIGHNLVIDHFRKEKNLRTVSNDDGEVDLLNSTKFADLTIEEEMAKKQVHGNVRELVEQLPFEQRQVVVMRHYMGMSFKEISQHTNVSINTALGRMRYALINMRKMILDQEHAFSLS
ncbi:RNA polymerase sigma factor [Salinivirga cyanobacteriivorans]|uniref:RNA polymerase sigma factor CarQ n=1 Tax=Salinivirga cyanobacteriivorans TaxID=1307839 RepID=A0A0S2HVD8_9BACT|nr:sigma-70 family RNA polymerase sigma factor [Salinivirga cyanobacteriivorans]ALO13978.1 RNA polymerase sigma factor CarQ [Salinivirga cyanobacteriivorans]